MTRRDGITIGAITVFALGAALVLQGLFRANQESGPAEAPQLPRTAVLPDPVRAQAGPAMLRARVTDAETGARIEDGVVLRFAYAEGGDPVVIARGGAAGSDIVLAKAPGGTLVMTATRPYYMSPAPVSVGLEQGKTAELSIAMERLHAVTIRTSLPDGSTPALIGLARVAPLPRWPVDRPLLQWAEPIGDGFSFELPAGQYACCVPLRDYSRDAAGRAWMSAAQLNSVPGFVIPGPWLFAEFAVAGAADLKLPLPAPAATGAIKGRVRTSAGAPAAWEVVELIRIGPGPFRSMQATVLSGDTGRFEAAGLATGACEIRIRDVEGATKHVEIGAAPLEVEVNLPPAPEATGNAPGTVRMVVLRNGQPLAGAGMIVLGAGDANTWKSAPPGLRVGNLTGHPGIVEWHGVEAGKQYELTAWPYTARTVKVSVHGGATVRVALDIAPEGTGALRMTVPAGDEHWYEVMTAEGDRLAVANPDLDAVVQVQGLPAGEVVITVFNDHTDKRRATATLEAGTVAEVVWATQAVAPPAPAPKAPEPDSPKDSPSDGEK
jgi:hypothetical protein